MTLGNILRRFLLYLGIALAVLVIFAAATVLSKGAFGRISGAWWGLVVFTSCLFWVTIRQSRAYWPRVSFWFATAGLLIVHLLLFWAVLRIYPGWRGIWFLPVIVVEGGFFGAILYALFGRSEAR